MPRVVHFEIPVDDPDRARTFYASVFGWELAGWGDTGYWLATTGPGGEPGINGALIRRSDLHAAPVVVVGVTSLEETVRLATAAGAQVLVKRQTIPTVGYSAYVRDTEGNVIGLFEAAEGARAD